MELGQLSAFRVSTEYAAITRMIGNGLTLPLRIANESADLVLRLSASEPSDETRPEEVFTLSFDAGDIELSQGQRFLRILSGIDYPEGDDIDTERQLWFSSAILGRLGDTPFASAHRISRGWNIRHDETVSLNLTIRGSRHSTLTAVRADAKTWLSILGNSRWKALDYVSPALERLPIRHCIRIATHRLDADVLSSIVQGDVLLPERCHFDCDGNGVLRIGGIGLIVRHLDFNRLTVINVEEIVGNDIERSAGVSDDEAPGANGVSHFERMMPPRDSAAELPDSIADEDVEDGMSADDSDDAAPESDDESDFDDNDDDDDSDIDDDDDVDDDDLAINGHDEDRDVANSDASDDADHSHLDSRETPLPGSLMSGIPVTLTFELGDVSLSLGELSKIGPGVILEIIDGSPASIAITCSGKRLGKGEIVDVDGRLGIRITGWEQQC